MKRSGIHDVIRHRYALGPDMDEAKKCVHEFNEYIEAKGFLLQQVFNCDQTCKMPNRTCITNEGEALPGHKPRIIARAQA